MSTYAFAPLAEDGHFHSVFPLAQKLLARGHRVWFLGVPDFEDVARGHGFEFAPYLETVFVKGSMAQQAQTIRSGGLLNQIRTEARMSRMIRDFWLGDAFGKVLAQVQPHLLIVDSYQPYAALAARRFSVPSILLSITFPQAREAGIPPLSTPLPPPTTPAESRCIEAAWDQVFARAKRGVRMARWFGIDIDYTGWMREIAGQVGYPLSAINTENEFVPGLDLPELILCPQELDFPRSPRRNRYYIEPGVELGENGTPFPWERIREDKPLIFCSLGTQSHRTRGSRHFFRTLIDAISQRPDWQLVVVTGKFVDAAALQPPAQNVTVVQWTPYNELLSRSALMINHAGLGTIKPCIYFGVPMIMFPFIRDQFGNAARMVYHGLGEMGGALAKVTVQSLQEQLQRLLSDTSMRQRMATTQQKFRELEASGAGVRLIEQFTSQPG